MTHNEEIRRELKEMSSSLEKAEKQNPFITPDYYFQSLPDKVLGRAKASPSSAQWFERLEQVANDFFASLFRPRFALPVSAFLLSIIVAIALLKNNNMDSAGNTQPLSEITSEEIRLYAMDHFDEDDMAALAGIFNGANGFIPSDIPNKTLEDYIQNNSDFQNSEEDFL